MKSLSLSKPHLLIMTGIPSSGKSFFAEKFSDTFSAPFVNLHHIWQATDDAHLAKQVAGYMLEEIVKTKQSIIVEGQSDTRKERIELAKFARDHGYEPLFVWVQTDPTTAQTRAARPGKTKTNRVLPADEHEKVTKRFNPLVSHEKHIVISGKHTYPSQAKVVLKKLSEPRAAISQQAARPPRSATSTNQQPEPQRRNISIG